MTEYEILKAEYDLLKETYEAFCEGLEMSKTPGTPAIARAVGKIMAEKIKELKNIDNAKFLLDYGRNMLYNK